MNKIIAVPLGIFATILLGAIGSGLWERVLSPFLIWISNSITLTIASISTTYSNSIYRSIASIPTSSQLSGFVLLIFFFIVFGLFIHALGTKKENSYVSIFHYSFTYQFKGWYGIIQSGALLIIMFFFISTQSTITQIQRYSITQMEIIRPYIGEKKYHILRSDFLRITNESEFNSFINEVYQLAAQASVDIKQLELN